MAQEAPPSLDPPAEAPPAPSPEVQAAAPAPEEIPQEGLLDNDEAIRLFLGDPATTVEPSASVPKDDPDDFSFLLDSV